MMPNRILKRLRVRYPWGSAVGVSYCFLFLLIAAVSVFARFYRIDAVGFDGSDTIYLLLNRSRVGQRKLRLLDRRWY